MSENQNLANAFDTKHASVTGETLETDLCHDGQTPDGPGIDELKERLAFNRQNTRLLESEVRCLKSVIATLIHCDKSLPWYEMAKALDVHLGNWKARIDELEG